MIRSKLLNGNKTIITNVFPDAMKLHTATGKTFTSCYVQYRNMECKFVESRFKHFTLLRQQFQCYDEGKMEIDYNGEPLLLITLDKSGEMLRNRGTDRIWKAGEANLTISPQFDIAINQFTKNTRFEFFNIVLPKHLVKKLCETHSHILSPFLKAFSLEAPIYFKKENISVSKHFLRIINNIEHCCDMGNYADKYLETKVLDCLSVLINRIEGSEKDFKPVNLVMSYKMHDARDIIKAQYKMPPSLNKLASMVGTNECTLKAYFKHIFGITVFQYIFEYRMTLAKQYLLDSSLPIAEIGFLLGYDYPSHFCTAFRRKYGMTPSSFRALHK